MTTITATTHSTTTAETTTTTVAADRRTGRRFPVLRAGVASGAVAAVATVLVAAVAKAAGVPVEVDGTDIPLLGFAQLTMVGALLGVVIARLSGRARQPRRAFVVTAMALTALTFVPDAIADATTATKSGLMLTHVVAAAIVVPVLARRVRP
jgi:hypothetical protein